MSCINLVGGPGYAVMSLISGTLPAKLRTPRPALPEGTLTKVPRSTPAGRGTIGCGGLVTPTALVLQPA